MFGIIGPIRVARILGRTRLFAQSWQVLNMQLKSTYVIPHQIQPYFKYIIGHMKDTLSVCSKHFDSPQILFYTTICNNPKSGPGPKIRVFSGSWSVTGPESGPIRSSDPPCATMH